LIQAPNLAGWKLDKYFFPSAIKARNRFVKFVSRVVKEKMEKMDNPSTDCADLFSNLITAKDPETGLGFKPQEIGAESTTLIVAGMLYLPLPTR
jgi:cytochrome P450